MSAPNLSDLERLARAATPGPWTIDEAPRPAGSINATVDGRNVQVASADGQAAMFDMRAEPHAVQHANAAFIAAANPTAVIALIERVRELEAGLGEALSTINHLLPNARCDHLSDFVGRGALTNDARCNMPTPCERHPDSRIAELRKLITPR